MAKTNQPEKPNRHGVHKNKWHTQVRDIEPEVWARIKAGATARYVQENGRTRPLNIGEYITRMAQLTEAVRHAADTADSEQEFYKVVTGALEDLGLETVHA